MVSMFHAGASVTLVAPSLITNLNLFPKLPDHYYSNFLYHYISICTVKGYFQTHLILNTINKNPRKCTFSDLYIDY